VLVSADDTGLILFWDAARKRVLKRVEPPAKKQYGVNIACAPGGSLCAADDLAGKLTVWDINTRGAEYEITERMSYPSLTPINIPVHITPVFAGLNLLVMIGEASTYNRKQNIVLVDLDQATVQPVVKTLTVPADVTREEFVARALTVNPATKTLAIGFNYGVALWHMDELDRPATWIRPPQQWVAKQELISSLSLSPDGKYLGVSSIGGNVAVWTLSDEKPMLVNEPHTGAGTFVAFFNQTQNGREATYMVTAYRGGQITLWDPWNAPPVWETSFEPDVSDLIFIGDTGRFATGSSDGLLALWDMARVSPLSQTLAGFKRPRAFAFGRTSGLLYAASDSKSKDDPESRLWRAQGGPYEPLGPGERRPEFAAGEFGLQLLSDVSSDYINLRDVYGGRPDEMRVEIKHTPNAPRAVSPDGRTLAIGDAATRPWDISEVEPTSIVIWDISDKAHPRRLNSLNFDGRPVSLFFADDGSTLAASYDNGKIVIWDYVKGTRRKQIAVPKAQSPEPGRRHNVGRIALSPDGRLLAGMTGRGIGLWDVETGLLLGRLGLEVYTFRNTEGVLDSMIFSRDRKTLVVASDRGFDLWDLNADKWAAMAADITNRR
jgi:WD40 repeat protein